MTCDLLPFTWPSVSEVTSHIHFECRTLLKQLVLGNVGHTIWFICCHWFSVKRVVASPFFELLQSLIALDDFISTSHFDVNVIPVSQTYCYVSSAIYEWWKVSVVRDGRANYGKATSSVAIHSPLSLFRIEDDRWAAVASDASFRITHKGSGFSGICKATG